MYKSFHSILSLALTLLFIFPTGYRFTHVLKHHAPFVTTHNHSHHHANNHECSSQKKIPSKVIFEEYEADCPVVAYEFAIFDIHFIPKSTSKVFAPDIYSVLPGQKNASHFKGKLFQLRAPPFCV